VCALFSASPGLLLSITRTADDFFDKTATFARTNQLNRYMKKRAAKGGINLLSGKNSTGTGMHA
jgi:hypothetical protein